MTVQPKILIAEDETLVRLDLRALLERAGFAVVAEARDGEEAVALAHAHAPDLAILDVKMPRLDGIEAARRIVAERRIPIVMLTAYGYGELIARALDAGVCAYLVKPFREADLLQAVRTAWADAGAPIDVDLASADGGTTWPLKFLRRPDGGLDVSLRGGEG
jgi:CheY-like chemotaxis protein